MKIAVVQIGCSEVLKNQIAAWLEKVDADWYLFEEDVDYDWEIDELKKHYEQVVVFKGGRDEGYEGCNIIL